MKIEQGRSSTLLHTRPGWEANIAARSSSVDLDPLVQWFPKWGAMERRHHLSTRFRRRHLIFGRGRLRRRCHCKRLSPSLSASLSSLAPLSSLASFASSSKSASVCIFDVVGIKIIFSVRSWRCRRRCRCHLFFDVVGVGVYVSVVVVDNVVVGIVVFSIVGVVVEGAFATVYLTLVSLTWFSASASLWRRRKRRCHRWRRRRGWRCCQRRRCVWIFVVVSINMNFSVSVCAASASLSSLSSMSSLASLSALATLLASASESGYLSLLVLTWFSASASYRIPRRRRCRCWHRWRCRRRCRLGVGVGVGVNDNVP